MKHPVVADIWCSNMTAVPALVAHACNPSYSGGRDQEDCGSKPVQANSSTRHYLEKKAFTKKGWSGSRCTLKKKKKKKKDS
jgi:hypothetical protein